MNYITYVGGPHVLEGPFLGLNQDWTTGHGLPAFMGCIWVYSAW